MVRRFLGLTLGGGNYIKYSISRQDITPKKLTM